MFLRKKNKPIIQIFLLLLLHFSVISCNNNHVPDVKIALNNQLVDSLMYLHGNNIAILSCLRCNCFVESYTKKYRDQAYVPTGYSLFADSFCTKLPIPTIQLPQKVMDRISEDIYNLTLLKKRDGKLLVYVIPVNKSKTLGKITQKFFSQ